MPIYEYDCKKCGKAIEVIQKFSDPPLTTCPTCQGPVEKKISLTSFQLKGTGWYATDYKKPAGGASPTTTPAKSEEKKAETKVEPSPAAATDPPKKDSK